MYIYCQYTHSSLSFKGLFLKFEESDPTRDSGRWYKNPKYIKPVSLEITFQEIYIDTGFVARILIIFEIGYFV